MLTFNQKCTRTALKSTEAPIYLFSLRQGAYLRGGQWWESWWESK